MDAPTTPPVPIAIIGIGCLFPKAGNLETYWNNILHRVDAVAEVPSTHWQPNEYFNADPHVPDHTYAKRGAFLSPVDFSPLENGVTPHSLEATDSTQLLGLHVARAALEDAGYSSDRQFDRNRVSVILGVTGTLELVIPLGARLGHPVWRRALNEAGVDSAVAEEVIQRISNSYVDWQEDSFPGLLGNVVAGRIANRLNFGGTNCIVDAACASSLSALHLAMLELSSRRCDMALSGGMDTFNDIFMYMCFSKTPALSPTGDARPFDTQADGTILGEGLGCLVLKRLPDAEAAGDRIYAVIRSIGTSSDGKGHAIYAPSAAGQIKALRQAHDFAQVTTDTIELVEAHGTGTKTGDAAEVQALTEAFNPSGKMASWCALGSVKSQIGHTKAAAGAAGIIKAALALHHKVLPPTIKVTAPLDTLQQDNSPFYVNAEQRPWLPSCRHPRRAAVSSFGFGGSNFHCVLEEHQSEKAHIGWDGSVQIVAVSAKTKEQLWEEVDSWFLQRSWDETRVAAQRSRSGFSQADPYRIVMILRKGLNFSHLKSKIRTRLQDDSSDSSWTVPEGVYYSQEQPPGKLAFLFPGQGSQYVGMMRDFACQFPQMLDTLAEANAAIPAANLDYGADPSRSASKSLHLTDYIYPKSAFNDDQRRRQAEALTATGVAQPALGAVELGMYRICNHFGLFPDAVAGHSFGELTALCAAGFFPSASFFQLAKLRGQLMERASDVPGAMLAVHLSWKDVEKFVRDENMSLVLANNNAPQQCVISGEESEVERARTCFQAQGISCTRLQVAGAFHSPYMRGAEDPLLQALNGLSLSAPRIPVYANTTGRLYPAELGLMSKLLARQLVQPVRFMDLIVNMYGDGIRTFVEIGPARGLSALVRQILNGRSFQCIALDASSGRDPGQLDLARLLAQLAALGYPVNLHRWDDQPLTGRSEIASNFTVPISGSNYRSSNRKTLVRTMSNTPLPNNSVPNTASDELLTQSLNVTQEGLQSLQKLSEQTAALHRQFLEGQERALEVLQRLLIQHQRDVPQTGQFPTFPSEKDRAAGDNGISAKDSLAHDATTPPERPRVDPGWTEEFSCSAQGPPSEAREGGWDRASPVSAASSAVESDLILQVVAEKTGYPVEMLNYDMDLDADLGIDSIKRVEIFSTLQDRVPELPTVPSDQMGALRTVGEVAEFLKNAPSLEREPVNANETSLQPPQRPQAGDDGNRELLLEVVAEKTGYPIDILELDMDLDADLGIDSIKRVEIFSSIQERLPEVHIPSEHAGSVRTLAEALRLLDRTSAKGVNGVSFQNKKRTTVQVEGRAPEGLPLQCLEVQLRPLSESGGRPSRALRRNAPIWIIDDGSALGDRLAARLHERGLRTRSMPVNSALACEPLSLVGAVLLPPTSGTTDSFLKDAFSLLQHIGGPLRSAATQGYAVLLTVSNLDGGFGFVSRSRVHDPISGGLAGLLKSTAKEWPDVLCKAIDVSPVLDPQQAAEALAAEMECEGPVEIGMMPDGQFQLEMQEAVSTDADPMVINPGDVFLVTGGARGITFSVSMELARRYSPFLVLLGRTPLPEEPLWLTQLDSEKEIKQEIIRQSELELTPKDVECRYRQLIARREIRCNLRRLKEAGAQVVYLQADVRDAEAIKKAVQTVHDKFGPVRALLHGAGVIADRRIEKKTVDQFRAVYETKVAGLRHLLAELQSDPLKLLVLFSSSTARFGRVGQVDYAVANEVLNKIAQEEARIKPDRRVLSVNWGPWQGGMVTEELGRRFQKEGIDLISPEDGANFLAKEIRRGRERPVELVVFAKSNPLDYNPLAQGKKNACLEEGCLDSPSNAEECHAHFTAEPGCNSNLSLAFIQPVSLTSFPILRSHVLGGQAVVPLVLHLEWMAHGAIHANPGLLFHGFHDLQIFRGVKLSAEQECRLKFLTGKARKDGDGYQVPVEVQQDLHDGQSLLHAKANILLRNPLPRAPDKEDKPLTAPYSHTTAEAYLRYLFHGPQLQGITKIEGVSAEAIIAQADIAPAPMRWIENPLRGNWIAEPMVLDASFQLMVLWCWENHGLPLLPTTIPSYWQFCRRFPSGGIQIIARITRQSQQQIYCDIDYLDRAGRVLAQIKDGECVMDASLKESFRNNRLPAEGLVST